MAKSKNATPTGFVPWLGVFETLRVENGRAQFIEEHWKSLRASAKALGLKVGDDFRETGRKLPRQAGRLRWVVEAGQSYVMFHPESLRVKPSFTLALAPQRLGSQNWDARYKTLSYLTHWQARRAVKADEALLLNENGHVATGAMSNVFWVQEGKVFTPALEAGCRDGVVRQWVRKSVKVTEGVFTPDVLASADEIFLTNSWIGIRPVGKFGKRALRPVPGAVTRGLQKRFSKL